MEKPTENGVYHTTVDMAKKLPLLDLSKEEFVKKVVSITTPRHILVSNFSKFGSSPNGLDGTC